MPAPVLPFVAFVLAGGLGTRLRSVVSDRPKPMALVAGVPFLEILIESLAGKGVREFVLLTGYLGEIIEDHFRRFHRPDISIEFSREDMPLGTGGPVKNAEKWATDPTLLVNGDTFFDGDLDELYRLHEERAAQVTLSLLKVDDVSRYGSVVVDESGAVRGFREKVEGESGPGLINAGLSLLALDMIHGLPGGMPFSMERDIFPSLARSGGVVGLCRDRAFFDIGTPDSYKDFESFVREKKRDLLK